MLHIVWGKLYGSKSEFWPRCICKKSIWLKHILQIRWVLCWEQPKLPIARACGQLWCEKSQQTQKSRVSCGIGANHCKSWRNETRHELCNGTGVSIDAAHCCGWRLIQLHHRTWFVSIFCKKQLLLFGGRKETGCLCKCRWLSKRYFIKINTAKYRKERDEFQKIWRYCIACSNLYGAITPEKVSELYKEHYSEIVTAKQIVEVMNTFACRSDAAAIKNGHIVNGFMFEHGNVDALLKNKEKKTYYMPEKRRAAPLWRPAFLRNDASVGKVGRLCTQNVYQKWRENQRIFGWHHVCGTAKRQFFKTTFIFLRDLDLQLKHKSNYAKFQSCWWK